MRRALKIGKILRTLKNNRFTLEIFVVPMVKEKEEVSQIMVT